MSIEKADLQPGATFEMTSLATLDDFQNEVALAVKPELHVGDWARVPNLSSLIRPKGFNGNFTEIVATSLENPYEMLLSSEERGIRFDGFSVCQRFRSDTPDLDYFTETTVGLRIDARGNSVKGALDLAVEVFFVQLPRKRRKQAEPVKPYKATVNTFGHFYDYLRGETVWCERTNDFRHTLRRPVSLPKYNSADLEMINNSNSLYNPAGSQTPGSNPSYKYND